MFRFGISRSLRVHWPVRIRGLEARLKLSLARTRMAPFYEDVQGTDGDTSSGEPQYSTAAIIIKAGAWDLLGPKRVDQR